MSGSDGVFHNAAYDSYCTGLVLIKMLGYISSFNKSERLDFSDEKINILRNKVKTVNTDYPFICTDCDTGKIFQQNFS